MSADPAPAGVVAGLDVLQRALDYTGDVLLDVRPAHLDQPTPCAGWRLGDLLVHMDDGLDAFAEAPAGTVALQPAVAAPVRARVAGMRSKACGLVAAWLDAGTDVVRIGGHVLPLDAVARVAALEITVHGWDVARTIGADRPLPEPLAVALLDPAARAATDPASAGAFAPPLPVPAGAPAGVRVLALLGRADRS